MKPFFIKIPNFWAWADKFWGIFDIFGQTINTHFVTVSPLAMFSIIQPLFLQKNKPLYLHPQTTDTQREFFLTGKFSYWAEIF